MEQIPSVRRVPGRPLGSSRYRESDPRLLDQVADKLLVSPSLSTRSAILQLVGNAPAALRRLQGKFKERPRDEWVADAQRRKDAVQRLEEARVQRNRETLFAVTDLAGRLAEQVGESRQLQTLRSAHMAAVERLNLGVNAMMSSPLFKQMQAQQKSLEEHPLFDQIRVFEKSARDAFGSRYLEHFPKK